MSNPLNSFGSVHWPRVPQFAQTMSAMPFAGDAALLLLELLQQVVLPIPLVAVGAFDQRIGEGGDVAGGDPDLARQDHRRVKPDDVLARPHHVVPPLALDVVLELDAQRAVVPGGLGAAIDLARGVDEAAALRQRDDGIDLGVVLGGGHS